MKNKLLAKLAAIICVLFGHSRIQTYCFGYYSCARCGVQLGDSLGSIYLGAEKAVIVGHNCPMCRENAKKLTWKDRLLCPNPFDDKGGEALCKNS